MKEVSIAEYNRVQIPQSDVSDEDLQYLAQLQQRHCINCNLSPQGDVDIESTAYVGIVQLSKLRLEIVPKIEGPDWSILLIHMLSRVYGIRHLDKLKATAFSSQSSILENFARYFLEAVNQLVSKGIRLGYTRERACTNAVRGRVLLKELYNPHFLFEGKIRCEFELLSEDRLENRIVRTALDRVSWLHLGHNLQTSMRYIAGLFEGVTINQSIVGNSVDDVVFTRLNEHYRQVLAISRLILDRMFIAFSRGGTPFYSFLIDMNELFERYIVTMLSDHFGTSYRLKPHPHFRIEGEPQNTIGSITLEPDFIVYGLRGPVLVGDAKYKGALVSSQFATQSLRNQDFYQALAYAATTGLTSLLVYPIHALGYQIADVFRLPSSTVAVVTADLSQPPDLIGSDVLKFVKKLLL